MNPAKITTSKILKVALTYAENIVNTVREPLIIMDKDLRIITAGRSFYQTFQVDAQVTEGQLIYNIGNGQWNIPKLRKLLEEILPKHTQFNDYEVTHVFPNIGKRIMLLNARRILIEPVQSTQSAMILLAIEDITERRNMEIKLNASETTFRRLFETTTDGIFLIEKIYGQIKNVNSSAIELFGYSNEEFLKKQLQI